MNINYIAPSSTIKKCLQDIEIGKENSGKKYAIGKIIQKERLPVGISSLNVQGTWEERGGCGKKNKCITKDETYDQTIVVIKGLRWEKQRSYNSKNLD